MEERNYCGTDDPCTPFSGGIGSKSGELQLAIRGNNIEEVKLSLTIGVGNLYHRSAAYACDDIYIDRGTYCGPSDVETILIVDPYIYIDPSTPNAEDYKILTVNSMNPDDWVEHKRFSIIDLMNGNGQIEYGGLLE